jgi:hypothetical protein
VLVNFQITRYWKMERHSNIDIHAFRYRQEMIKSSKKQKPRTSPSTDHRNQIRQSSCNQQEKKIKRLKAHDRCSQTSSMTVIPPYSLLPICSSKATRAIALKTTGLSIPHSKGNSIRRTHAINKNVYRHK